MDFIFVERLELLVLLVGCHGVKEECRIGSCKLLDVDAAWAARFANRSQKEPMYRVNCSRENLWILPAIFGKCGFPLPLASRIPAMEASQLVFALATSAILA